jgi:hypothetical protein
MWSVPIIEAMLCLSLLRRDGLYQLAYLVFLGLVCSLPIGEALRRVPQACYRDDEIQVGETDRRPICPFAYFCLPSRMDPDEFVVFSAWKQFVR